MFWGNFPINPPITCMLSWNFAHYAHAFAWLEGAGLAYTRSMQERRQKSVPALRFQVMTCSRKIKDV